MGRIGVTSDLSLYAFEQRVIPEVFRNDPAEFFAAVEARGGNFLRDLFATAFVSDNGITPQPPDELEAEMVEIDGATRAALLTFPEPQEHTEAYRAVALLADGQPRYLALESAGTESGAMLCECLRNGHRSWGDARGTNVEEFLKAVAGLLRRSGMSRHPR